MVVSHPQCRTSSAPAQPAPKRFGRRWFVTRGRRVGDLFGCMSPSSGELSLERHRFPPPERSSNKPPERREEEPRRQKTVEELAEEESCNISRRISSSVLANHTAVGQPQNHPKKPPTTGASAATTASPQHASSRSDNGGGGIVTHSERVYDVHRALQIRKQNIVNRHGNRADGRLRTYRALSPAPASHITEPRKTRTRDQRWAEITAAVVDDLPGGGQPGMRRIREEEHEKNRKEQKSGILHDAGAATLKRFSDLICKRDRKAQKENAADKYRRQWFDNSRSTGQGKATENAATGLESDSGKSRRKPLTLAAVQSSTTLSRARSEPSPASRAPSRTGARDLPGLCEIGNRGSYMYLQPTRQLVSADHEGGSSGLLSRVSSQSSSKNHRHTRNMTRIEEAREDDSNGVEEYPPSDSFALFRTDHFLLQRPYDFRSLEQREPNSPATVPEMQPIVAIAETPKRKHYNSPFSPPASSVGSEGESTSRAKRRPALLSLRPEPPRTAGARHRSEPTMLVRCEIEDSKPASLVVDWQQAAPAVTHVNHHHTDHLSHGHRCGSRPKTAARTGSELSEEDIPEPITVRYSPFRALPLHDRWQKSPQGSSRSGSAKPANADKGPVSRSTG